MCNNLLQARSVPCLRSGTLQEAVHEVTGPAVVQILEGEACISSYRSLMGATNPEEAEEGTIRKKFAESISKNAVHGSDSPESADREIEIMSALF